MVYVYMSVKHEIVVKKKSLSILLLKTKQAFLVIILRATKLTFKFRFKIFPDGPKVGILENELFVFFPTINRQLFQKTYLKILA